MLTITFIPDGSLAAAGIVLCATSRALAELNVRLNHRRLIDIANLWAAPAALARDFQNQRNTLSLTVRRGVDFNAAAFADAEAALLFALDHPSAFPATGTLQMQLAGPGGTNATRWLLNCAVEMISHAHEDLGVSPRFDYTFTGGAIVAVSPVFPITQP